MLINGKNYILLRRMGCNYRNDDGITVFSDVGNHRVRVQFTDKNGVDVIGDFSHGYKWDTSKKKPVMISMNALCADLQYEDKNGTWRYYPAVPASDFTYNVSDILAFVNALSAEQYDAIKWVESFEFIQDAGENFTPGTKISEYARTYKFETSNRYGDTIIHLYTGEYKYLFYSINAAANGKEIVTITLEAA